jgi:rRNA processing protein Krr1/Pno1
LILPSYQILTAQHNLDPTSACAAFDSVRVIGWGFGKPPAAEEQKFM